MKSPALLILPVGGWFGSVSGAELATNVTESYQIRNQKFGTLLRPEDARRAEGTPIVLYPAEPWKCMTWKLHPAGEACYQLQNHFTGKTFKLTPVAGQSNLVQVSYSLAADQRPVWHFKKVGEDLYEIEEAPSGRALTAVEADGNKLVVLSPWTGTDAQKWHLEKIDPANLTM